MSDKSETKTRVQPQPGTTANLRDLVDWDHVLAQPRYAGGHEEVMRAIFGSTSTVEAWWPGEGYQGDVAIAHRLADGRVVVMTDYYGSCSGCDAWEGAGDEEAIKLIIDAVNSARVFESLDDAKSWCASIDPKDPVDYPYSAAKHLW